MTVSVRPIRLCSSSGKSRLDQCTHCRRPSRPATTAPRCSGCRIGTGSLRADSPEGWRDSLQAPASAPRREPATCTGRSRPSRRPRFGPTGAVSIALRRAAREQRQHAVIGSKPARLRRPIEITSPAQCRSEVRAAIEVMAGKSEELIVQGKTAFETGNATAHPAGRSGRFTQVDDAPKGRSAESGIGHDGRCGPVAS